MASTQFINSVTLSQAGWFQDVDNVAYQFLGAVAGTNTITATGPVGLSAYAAGLKFRFIPAATNTGATTINITGTAALGARNIFYNGVACVGGELKIGVPVEIIDDGTQLNISSLVPMQGTWTPSVGGNATYTVQTGSYTRFGRLVFIRFSLTINVLGTGSGTTVSGLPFPSIAGYNPLSISGQAGLAASFVSVTAGVDSAASTVSFNTRTGASASEAFSSVIFINGSIISVAGCYQTT